MWDLTADPQEMSPIFTVINAILVDCLRRGVQEIEFAPIPGSGTFLIRARLGDSWEQLMSPTAKMYPTILRRLKEIGGLKSNLVSPGQEGIIRATVHGEPIQLPIRTHVMPHGAEVITVELPPRAAA